MTKKNDIQRTPATGASLCYVRSAPWSSTETGPADQQSCRVVGNVAIGGQSDAIAMYNAQVAPPTRTTKRVTLGVPYNKQVANGDMCLASAVPLLDACFMDDNALHVHWKAERAHIERPGVVALLAGGSIAQDVSIDHGWKPNQRYRVTITTQRKTLDFSYSQTVHASVTMPDGQTLQLGSLDIHNHTPETKDFPDTFPCPSTKQPAATVRLIIRHVSAPPSLDDDVVVFVSSVAIRLISGGSR